MADIFAGYTPFNAGISAPASSATAITPNDSADLATVTRAIYVGNAGDVAAILANDSASVVFKNCDGLLPLRVKRILVTGTTATGIVGLV